MSERMNEGLMAASNSIEAIGGGGGGQSEKKILPLTGWGSKWFSFAHLLGVGRGRGSELIPVGY